ncbi:MAG: hypothetical protein N3E49_06195 [Bacteroidia bacterium]|nr:hypothetical protein [Bacteroidia bacterium]
MVGALFWLQLWLLDKPVSQVITKPVYTAPLIHALYEADTLLRAFARRETLYLTIGGSSRIRLERLPGYTRLTAPDTMTAVAGLYLLLEEKHGISFFHPRLTVQTPHVPSWQTLEAEPRFTWRGFHLHTQHPIELTEALHDPDFPNGEALIRNYIDWLIRNRQNYFEFCLLRTVDLHRWLPYMTRIVDYARKRGITMGLDLSLRMQQQRAFQLMPRWKPKGKTLRRHLRQLSQTGITRLNVDLNAAEFVGKSWGSWIDSLIWQSKQLGLQVMSRQHVVPPEAYAVGDFQPSQLPPQLTLCVHSVMCYSLMDSLAPVYRCKDFSHLYRTLLTEQGRRPLWYYPETAYWVTFDNSVPVWLLSYLRSRLEDILIVESLAEGHLTFSSGWDVGYWLFDWSVARWSWRYIYDGVAQTPFPAEGFVRLFGGDTLAWSYLIRFQDSLLVGRNVLSYITPTTPIDEISWNRLPSFQPRLPVPPWQLYRHPRKYADKIEPMLQGISSALAIWPRWPDASPMEPMMFLLYEELKTAWDLTRLRVKFRSCWLQALISSQEARKQLIDTLYSILAQAEKTVSKLPIRYPHTAQRHLCRASKPGCKHPHPSYRFGYLYPAVSLHFWRREIGQVQEGRWGVLYSNLWDIPRIIGLW